jgi:hypothetical protein
MFNGGNDETADEGGPQWAILVRGNDAANQCAGSRCGAATGRGDGCPAGTKWGWP